MRGYYLDKNFKKFIALSVILIAGFFIILIVFGYIYSHSTINTYNFILLILILLTIIIALLFVLEVFAVLYAYRKKHISAIFLRPLKVGLNILLPFVTFISALVSNNKDDIRGFYININNILVQSDGRKYKPQEVLVLLPHCLQNTDCNYKITNDIVNCHKCGKCCIGDIAEISKNFGVMVAVATGGTAARSVVNSAKPKLILSVACERDLTSGIIDVGNTPVIGIINERPNGPCKNTSVDIVAFKKKLEDIIRY